MSSSDTWASLASALVNASWREPYGPYGFSTSSVIRSPTFVALYSPSRRAGYFARLDFSSNASLTFKSQGIEVAAAVAHIRKVTGASKVVLVGHSMGGLAARAYLQGSTYKGDVSALVTLGTPHTGSLAVGMFDYLAGKPTVWAAWVAALAAYPATTSFATLTTAAARALPAVGYLAPGSSEMKSINFRIGGYKELPVGVRYVSLVSTISEGNVFYQAGSESGVVKAFYDDWLRSKYGVAAGAISVCSANVQANWSDGIVPLCSQDLRASPASSGYKGLVVLAIGDVMHLGQTSEETFIAYVRNRSWSSVSPSSK